MKPNRNKELCLLYLQRYAQKDLAGVESMFAEDIILRDWKIRVEGKKIALDETRKNFLAADSIEIQVLNTYENENTVAAELKITVDKTEELYVIEVNKQSEESETNVDGSYESRVADDFIEPMPDPEINQNQLARSSSEAEIRNFFEDEKFENNLPESARRNNRLYEVILNNFPDIRNANLDRLNAPGREENKTYDIVQGNFDQASDIILSNTGENDSESENDLENDIDKQIRIEDFEEHSEQRNSIRSCNDFKAQMDYCIEHAERYYIWIPIKQN